MKNDKTIKLALLAAISSMSLSTFGQGSEYIVCKDAGNGKLQCEDGFYFPTGEKADKKSIDNISRNPVFPRNPNATLDSPHVKQRINSFVNEFRNEQSGVKFSRAGALKTILSSTTITSERAIALVQDLTKKPDFDKFSKEDLIKEISGSKVMI